MAINAEEIKEINVNPQRDKMIVQNDILYINGQKIGTAEFIQTRLKFADDCDIQIPIIKENILKLRGGSL